MNTKSHLVLPFVAGILSLSLLNAMAADPPVPLPATASTESITTAPVAESSNEEQALEELRAAIRLDPNYADARVALGTMLVNKGDVAGGISELRQALRIQPDHARARYELALALMRQRDDVASAEQERAATSKEPVLAEAYLDLGKTYAAAGNMPAAVAELREALRLQPNFTEARMSLGVALFNMGDVESAIEEYRAVLQERADLTAARMNLATALMAKHDWSAARAELQEVLRSQPDLVQAHYSLGVIRYTVGDIPGAIESYRTVVNLKSDYADAHYNLGLLLKMTDHDAEAAQEFEHAARAGLAKAQYFLGNAYAGGHGIEKNLARAITWWSHADEHGLVQAREAIAQLRRVALGYGKQPAEDTRTALQAFKDVQADMRREFPDVQLGTAADSIGAAFVRQGRATEAVTILIREASLLKESAQVQLENLYEQGVEGQLMAYDPRILAYFKNATAEGLPRPRVALARIYARGLGVPPDIGKAAGLLKGYPDEGAQQVMREISAVAQDTSQATKLVPPPLRAP